MAKSKQTPIESILGISPAKATELLGTLTEREQQVAVLMAAGTKNGKIAEQLKISTKTLDIHRTHIKRKLGAQSSVDVARVIFAEKFGEFLE